MIMAIYWTTESCSLAVTSLLPLLLFPILGVLKAKEISTPYFSDTNVLFIGGMMLAVAVEQWNLHKRIALKILLLIGTQPRRYIDYSSSLAIIAILLYTEPESSSDTKWNLI
jgi:sodium-dependent dicarboxylate transporter 2/3/5